MEPSYSQVSYNPWADWLSKFHTWPAFIQMLWLVVPLAALLGTTWLVMRGLRDIAAAKVRPPPEASGLLIYGVVQDGQGQWHVIRHGHEPKPLDWRNPPPEPMGQVAELD
jgi:hypothetical protein